MSSLAAVKQWVETVVIGLALCPFAKGKEDQIRYFHSVAASEEALLTDLHRELNLLVEDKSIETTLLIHPNFLDDFNDYNQFLDIADSLLEQLNLAGIIQIASFHPKYQFSDTMLGDAENYSNRSPYPMLHLLRESSLDDAIEYYGDTSVIPENNIRRLDELGADKMKQFLGACLAANEVESSDD